MDKPPFEYNPVCRMICAATFFALAAGLLIWRAVFPWTDYFYIAAGLLCGALLPFLDYLEFRRRGDALLLGILRGDTRAWWGHAWWWYAARIPPLVVIVASARAERSELSVVMGLSAGLALWYPHWRTVRKRMWELYEREQAATPLEQDSRRG